MNCEYIDTVLDDDLTIVEIEALKPIASSYTTAIIQPKEDLRATDYAVGNANQESAIVKYNAFFEKVYEDNIKLVLSPEYSCPWDSLKSVLNDKFPKEGSLWVLGCESLTYNDLSGMKEAYPDISFIYENIQATEGRNFLDPVVYCFNAKDNEGEVKKVIVVQFKQVSMVDHADNLERDHLIEGNVRYIIRNNEDSAYLTALICAEAMRYNFKDALPKPNHYYLIPHLQLNTKPYHHSFMGYRTGTFEFQDNIEYICVNWAKEFRINNGTPCKYGGSAIYLSSDKINNTDIRINENHKKGIYYAYAHEERYHIYNFNYDEHLFYIKTNQVLQSDARSIQRSRQGVESYETFLWDDDAWTEQDCPCDDMWQSNLMDDGFWDRISFLEPFEPLTKERFMSITSGQRLSNVKWWHPKHLASIRVDNREVSNSLSEFHDPRNRQNLDEITGRINWLKNEVISNDRVGYPDRFSDIEDVVDFVVHEDLSQSHLNISHQDGSFAATFVGLRDTTEQIAKRVFDNIASAIGSGQRRLIVWYKDDNNDLQREYDTDKPSIDDDYTESPFSIARGE